MRRIIGSPSLPLIRIWDSGWIAELPGNRRQACIYARPTVALRLSRALGPLLLAAHAWDASFARLIPALNVGCDTLTIYPDPHPETNTVDGYVQRSGSGESWSSIRNGSGTSADDSSTALGVYLLASSNPLYPWYLLRRSVLLFDTSPLGAGATVQSADLYLWCTLSATGLGDTTVDVVSAVTQYNTQLVTADYYYTNFGTTPFSQVLVSNLSTGQYNAFSFNSSGKSYINVTGITRIGLRLGWDTVDYFGGTWSAGAGTAASFYSADNADLTNDPKLVITYTPGIMDKYMATQAAVNASSQIALFSDLALSSSANVQAQSSLSVEQSVSMTASANVSAASSIEVQITETKSLSSNASVGASSLLTVYPIIDKQASTTANVNAVCSIEVTQFVLPADRGFRTGTRYRKI